jgi:hypothetical protein
MLPMSGRSRGCGASGASATVAIVKLIMSPRVCSFHALGVMLDSQWE